MFGGNNCDVCGGRLSISYLVLLVAYLIPTHCVLSITIYDADCHRCVIEHNSQGTSFMLLAFFFISFSAQEEPRTQPQYYYSRTPRGQKKAAAAAAKKLLSVKTKFFISEKNRNCCCCCRIVGPNLARSVCSLYSEKRCQFCHSLAAGRRA